MRSSYKKDKDNIFCSNKHPYQLEISKLIDKDYSRGKSATGKPSYDGVLLFRMCLLQSWYGLSDYEVEDRINDSISFSYFCGLTIEQASPDHSTLSRVQDSLNKNRDI